MKASLRITDNFVRNLEGIEEFLLENPAEYVFDRLVDDLLNSVFESLMCFPRMGINYLQRSPDSLQAQSRLKALQKKLKHTEFREYIFGDYLLLYVLREKQIFLLAIKHHRQLAFDLNFKNLWV